MGANTHRGGLATRVEEIWPDRDLFERLGGREKLGRIVEGLYSRIEKDLELRPLFGNEVGGDRSRQKMFFEEWMGGEPRYSRIVGGLGTRLFHYRFHITRRTAGRWLRHLTESLREEGVEPALVREILSLLGPMAQALKYEDGPPLPREIRVGLDLENLRKWTRQDPGIFRHCPGNSQRLFLKALLQGRFDVVQLLIEHGVRVNTPFWHNELMITPWCLAKHLRHEEIAEYLLGHGARIDVFSAAYLGDLELLTSLIETDPNLIDAQDPALDHLAITPLHHAVRGEQAEVVEWLLERGAAVDANSILLIRSLAEKRHVELTRLLLQHGADAVHLGPGHWVLGREMADLLVAHGADVNRPPGQWLKYCTAYLGQKDEPDLIAALVSRGADLSARWNGQTALHLAANAGHLRSLEVLLDHGVDIDVEDDDGNTALSYVAWSRKRADRVATAKILLSRGADPKHRNHKGETPREQARKSIGRDAMALRELLDRSRHIFV